MAPTETSQPVSESGLTGHDVSSLPHSYYDFGTYVTKTRMLTFWHQLDEVLKTEPRTVLEVGVGAGVVTGTLRQRGIEVTTLDLNDSLRPDIVGSVVDLDSHFDANTFDTVLCARVLHHVPHDELEICLEQLARVAKTRVILTLPCDELRLYAAVRRTAGAYRIRSVALPLVVKRFIARFVSTGDERYRRLWKINSSPTTSMANITTALERSFHVTAVYAVPEDQSHIVAVLRPR